VAWLSMASSGGGVGGEMGGVGVGCEAGEANAGLVTLAGRFVTTLTNPERTVPASVATGAGKRTAPSYTRAGSGTSGAPRISRCMAYQLTFAEWAVGLNAQPGTGQI